jgi:hypothetical protein
MSQVTGFVAAGLQLGPAALIIRPTRKIGPFVAQVTITESHSDELEITQHPVEQGAAISDHAFKRPAELTLTVGWSNSPAGSGSNAFLNAGLGATVLGLQGANPTAIATAGFGGAVGGAIGATGAAIQGLLSGNSPGQAKDIYQKLLKLQEERIPFDVMTGKRSYVNMLIKSLQVMTDKTTENALIATLHLQQVILVSTRPLQISAAIAAQRFPGSTNAPTSLGTKILGTAVDNAKAAVLSIIKGASK